MEVTLKSSESEGIIFGLYIERLAHNSAKTH